MTVTIRDLKDAEKNKIYTFVTSEEENVKTFKEKPVSWLFLK